MELDREFFPFPRRRPLLTSRRSSSVATGASIGEAFFPPELCQRRRLGERRRPSSPSPLPAAAFFARPFAGDEVHCGVEVSTSVRDIMSTVGGTRRAPRRQTQDSSGDKVVVNLEASPPVVGTGRAVSAAVAGAQNSPIDVEAIEDEVQAVSPSRVPPPRNRRARRRPITVVDLEVEASREGNKRQRVVPVVHCLSPHRGEGSTLQSNKEVPKEPTFSCPICWNKMEQPSTTSCGHVFCDTCIKQAIKVQKKCPTCRKALRINSVHRIYLPSTTT